MKAVEVEAAAGAAAVVEDVGIVVVAALEWGPGLR